MTKFSLYRSAEFVRHVTAETIEDAAAMVGEFTAPKFSRVQELAYQWVGDIPYELFYKA